LVVGGQNFNDPKVVVMVVVVAIVGLLMLMPFARYLAKFSQLGSQERDDLRKLHPVEQSPPDEARRAS
jgi:hypothetical protein